LIGLYILLISSVFDIHLKSSRVDYYITFERVSGTNNSQVELLRVE